MPDPASATSRGPDGPGSSGPGDASEALVARGHPGADRPSELCEHVTDRLPSAGRLVRDQLGQASLEVTLDLAHELLSLVEGQLFFRLIEGEQPVGWLWLVVPFRGSDPAMAWVNYVQVDEEYRGRGYGKQAMLLAEEEAAARGVTSVGLNVLVNNTVARGLYDSLGYQVTAQQMKKVL
jgi:ribosomal protein S18 acetylase RimI-like enzyme